MTLASAAIPIQKGKIGDFVVHDRTQNHVTKAARPITIAKA